MEVLSKKDVFKLKNQTLIAEYDFDTLIALYQPIVGYEAISVYMTLWSLTKHSTNDEIFRHDFIFLRMMMEPGHFVKARKKLEAVNLLKTVLIRNSHGNIYIYSLRAPETPKNFFGNILLHGLLANSLGEKETAKQKSLFKYEPGEDEGIDISADMSIVFDKQDETRLLNLLKERDELTGRIRASLATQFDHALFLDYLVKSSQIKKESITSDHLKEIERIAALYGVDEMNMALIVTDCFLGGTDSDKRINFEEVINQSMMFSKIPSKHREKKGPSLVSSDTDLGKKINLMESCSPKEYLRTKQNDVEPVKPDLLLIEELSTSLQLNPPVINALIDYVLYINDNKLSRAYVLKIGASLAREGAKTAYDAMVFLKRTNHFRKPSYSEIRKSRQAENTTKTKNVEEENPVNWDELLAD